MKNLDKLKKELVRLVDEKGIRHRKVLKKSREIDQVVISVQKNSVAFNDNRASFGGVFYES